MKEDVIQGEMADPGQGYYEHKTETVIDLPKVTLDLTAEELYQAAGAISFLAESLERDRLFSAQHRAERYRILAARFDHAYGCLTKWGAKVGLAA